MIKQQQNIGYFGNGNIYVKMCIIYDTENDVHVLYHSIRQRYFVGGERAYISTFKKGIECGIKINFEYENETQWWDN